MSFPTITYNNTTSVVYPGWFTCQIVNKHEFSEVNERIKMAIKILHSVYCKEKKCLRFYCGAERRIPGVISVGCRVRVRVSTRVLGLSDFLFNELFYVSTKEVNV